MSKRTGRTGSKNKISSRIGVITVICCLALLAGVVMYKARNRSATSPGRCHQRL